jgi:pimeloyl-ACP methyl ester carboxylesterase
VSERLIEADGVELCAEAFGDPADPPILLIMGMQASMLWWEEGFCQLLAGGGRLVIRYDHRDTGRSAASEPGRPEYSGAVFAEDALRVLDGLGLRAAHVVGLSMGGGIAQELALDAPQRVATLTLISTTAVGAMNRRLPPPAAEYLRFMNGAEVNWSNPRSVVEYLVSDWQALSGPERPFDQAHFRELAERDVQRARSFSSMQNHSLVSDDAPRSSGPRDITTSTLVIHGTADPLFPLAHGKALAEEIPRARLLTLEGAGHGLDRADWEEVTGAILEHTHEQ